MKKSALRKIIYTGFSEDGYCNSCGIHYENVDRIQGCEKCIRHKEDEDE